MTRERGTERSEFSEDAFLYREDYGMLATRVERFDTEYAWAENPLPEPGDSSPTFEPKNARRTTMTTSR